jgi:Predicted transcriptional regulators containing the CopG/Arc/MetJ DNA-binding domain
MKIISVKLPESYVEGIDELVKMGRFRSRSEAIRFAVRELLRRELWCSRPRQKIDELIAAIKRLEKLEERYGVAEFG